MTMAQGGASSSKDLIRSVSGHSNNLMSEVAKVIIGKPENIRKVTIGILANGNILIEDNPGLAKTMMSNTFAQALGCKFKRVQFTPDLLPSDIMGTYMYDQQAGEFKLRPGPLFTNILLADEINRATPKSQSALLEAMEENQVTVDGTTHLLDRPFIVVATQNHIEYEGTFPLPEAQLDTFLIRVTLGYPDISQELDIIDRLETEHPLSTLGSVVAPKDIIALQDASISVYVDQTIRKYIVNIVEWTRHREQISLGASPRASIGLFHTCRALALIRGRDYVIPDDVKELATPVLARRLVLSAAARISGVNASQIISDLLEFVPVPI